MTPPRTAALPKAVSSSKFRLRLIWRAMFLRRRRLSIALAALTVGAMLASALLVTYADLDRKLSGELRRYGANLIVAPLAGADTLPFDTLKRAESVTDSAVPFLYAVGKVNDRDVVIGGTIFASLLKSPPSWKLVGDWPSAPDTCVAGERVGLHVGDRVMVSAGGAPVQVLVTGIISSGGSEDSQILTDIFTVQRLAKLGDVLSVIQVNAPPGQIDSVRQRLAVALPDAEVRVLRAVAESTAKIMLRVRGLLYSASLVILGIVVLAVATTLYAIVLDRRRDIGVMKALGAGEAQIAGLLVAEAAALGCAGGVAGCAIGVGLAEWIGRAIYQSGVSVRPLAILEVLLLTVAVAVVATLFPLQVARGVSPAAVLKGE